MTADTVVDLLTGTFVNGDGAPARGCKLAKDVTTTEWLEIVGRLNSRLRRTDFQNYFKEDQIKEALCHQCKPNKGPQKRRRA